MPIIPNTDGRRDRSPIEDPISRNATSVWSSEKQQRFGVSRELEGFGQVLFFESARSAAQCSSCSLLVMTIPCDIIGTVSACSYGSEAELSIAEGSCGHT